MKRGPLKSKSSNLRACEHPSQPCERENIFVLSGMATFDEIEFCLLWLRAELFRHHNVLEMA